jgi:hypothetical protein
MLRVPLFFFFFFFFFGNLTYDLSPARNFLKFRAEPVADSIDCLSRPKIAEERENRAVRMNRRHNRAHKKRTLE